MFVGLKKGWPGPFRRTVKDEKGAAISILEWSPTDDGPMEITDPLELEAIKNDLGKALVEVKPRKPLPVAASVEARAKPLAKKVTEPKSVPDATHPLKV